VKTRFEELKIKQKTPSGQYLVAQRATETSEEKSENSYKN